MSVSYSKSRTFKRVLFTLTTDGSGDATGTSEVISGEINRVVVVPGAGVSNGVKVKLSDETTYDLLDSDGNDGVAIDDASLPKEFPLSKAVDSALTCTISAGGDTKSIWVYVYYR